MVKRLIILLTIFLMACTVQKKCCEQKFDKEDTTKYVKMISYYIERLQFDIDIDEIDEKLLLNLNEDFKQIIMES